jgi:hypothetical protein
VHEAMTKSLRRPTISSSNTVQHSIETSI